MPRGESVRAATRQGLWVGIATGAYGISFGALSVAAGLDVWQTMVLSLVMFTGGSQFAFVGIVGGGGAGGAAVATAALLGVRNSLYGVQLARLLAPRGWRRPAAAHLTMDESTAVALAQPDETAGRSGFWVTGLAVFTCWNATTLIGALLGDVLGDPARWGLDGAAVAAFLALLWPRLKERDAPALAVVAALVAAVAIPVVPAGVPVLLAALVTGVLAWFRYRRQPDPIGNETPEAAP